MKHILYITVLNNSSTSNTKLYIFMCIHMYMCVRVCVTQLYPGNMREGRSVVVCLFSLVLSKERLFWNMHEHECSVSLFSFLRTLKAASLPEEQTSSSAPQVLHTCIIRVNTHMQRLKMTARGTLITVCSKNKEFEMLLSWFCCGCHSRS